MTVGGDAEVRNTQTDGEANAVLLVLNLAALHGMPQTLRKGHCTLFVGIR